jgi:hypothetical protein
MPVPPLPIQLKDVFNLNFENGEDSDGEVGPFWDTVEGEQYYDSDDDEMHLPSDGLPATDSSPELVPNTIPIDNQPNEGLPLNTPLDMTEEALLKLTNGALRDELRKRGQSTNGNKTTMVHRLLTGVPRRMPRDAAVRRNQNNTNEGNDDRIRGELNGFAVGAKWRELTPNEVPVSNPESRGNLRAPTAPEGEEFNDRHNFDCTFDHAPFTELCEVFKCDNKGKLMKKRNGEQLMEMVVRSKGRANPDWLKKHKLTPSSKPEKWIAALLPDKRLPSEPKQTISFNDWCSFTNKKAELQNAGEHGGIYPEWKRFSPEEIKRFIGLYLLNGLCPTPQLK